MLNQLATMDDASYFSVMRTDILALQRRVRAFATPRKGTEVSEASLQLIVGGSNVLQAKLALHELLQEKMMQLERAVAQATAGTAPDTPATSDTPSGVSRLPFYLMILDRLQYLHAEAVEGGRGGGDEEALRARADDLQRRVQERDRANATLEREIMELQSALRAKEAEAKSLQASARAEGAAAGADALRHGEEAQRAEMARLKDEAAAARADATAAATLAEELQAKVDGLDAALASALSAAEAAKAAPRDDGAPARLRELEQTLEQRDATIAGLKRALSELENRSAEVAAAEGGEAEALRKQVQRLEADLKQEKVAAKNAQIFLQTRIDQLSTQLEVSSAGDSDQGMVKHMQGESERLQAELDSVKAVLEATKRELDLVQRPPGDSFEEVMIEELRVMRETFEGKLNAAADAAKEKQAAHRRELRELKEAHEKDRAAMESRINYLNAKAGGAGA